MIHRFRKIFKKPNANVKTLVNNRKIWISEILLQTIADNLQPKLKASHEGIIYFGGLIANHNTIVLTVLVPEAITTYGSFDVSSRSMSSVINQACLHGLEIVGQLHTHPRAAFHSDGDIEGATMVRPGFVSIVIPNYGRMLPALNGSCVFSWEKDIGFVEHSLNSLHILPIQEICHE